MTGDLFGNSENPAPKPQRREQPGPKPWPGCDTASEPWRAYCEAWSHVFTRKPKGLRALIAGQRGAEGLAYLDRCIRVVKDDYAGKIPDRAAIPDMLEP